MLKKLRTIIGRYRDARLIIIGYGFFAPGGAWKSIHQYYLHMSIRGEQLMLITRPWRRSFRQMVMSFLFGRTVIFNGLDSFLTFDSLLFCLLRRDAILYLHETEFIFENFRRSHPLCYRLMLVVIRRNRVCCVSQRQQEYLRTHFGAQRTHVLYENVAPYSPETIDVMRTGIVMVGTIDPRKGATLFSQVADLAQQRHREWQFYWIGAPSSVRDVYLSSNVRWLGAKPDVFPFLQRSELFFLSSVDDPFPLACLEALSIHRKCVVYRNTGLAEIVEDVPGCAVYESYDAEAAFAAIERALATPLDRGRIDAINESVSSIYAFADRIEHVLQVHHSGGRPLPGEPPLSGSNGQPPTTT